MWPARRERRSVAVSVTLTYDPITGWPPYDTETLWTTPVGGGRYRVRSVPFFARGIAVGDVVSVEPGGDPEDGPPTFSSVVEHSGHLTVWVKPFPVGWLRGEMELMHAMLDLPGVEAEGAAQHELIALDIGPEAPLVPLAALLSAGELASWWSFVEGKTSDAWESLGMDEWEN